MTNSLSSEKRTGRIIPWDSRARALKKSGTLLTRMRPLKIYATDAYDESLVQPRSLEMSDGEEALHSEVVVLENFALSNVQAILRKSSPTALAPKTTKFDFRRSDAHFGR